MVGTDSAASSTSTALADSVGAGSGTVTLSCGAAPVSIVITQLGGLIIPNGDQITMDGGNKIELSARLAWRVFVIEGGAVYPRFPPAMTVITGTTFDHNFTTNSTDGWGGAMLLWDGGNYDMPFASYAFSLSSNSSCGFGIGRDNVTIQATSAACCARGKVRRAMWGGRA